MSRASELPLASSSQLTIGQESDGVDVDDAADVLDVLLGEGVGQAAVLPDHPDEELVVEGPGLAAPLLLAVAHHAPDDGEAGRVVPALEQHAQGGDGPVQRVTLLQ